MISFKFLQLMLLSIVIFYCGNGLKLQKTTQQEIKSGVRGGAANTEYIVYLKNKGKKGG